MSHANHFQDSNGNIKSQSNASGTALSAWLFQHYSGSKLTRKYKGPNPNM